MIPMEVPEVMATLLSSTAGISRTGNAVTEHETYIPMQATQTFSTPAIGDVREDFLSSCITRNTGGGGETQNPAFVLQAIPIDSMNHLGRNNPEHSLGDFVPVAPSYTLTKQHSHAVAQPFSFDLAQITSKTNASKVEPGLPASTISKNSDMHVIHGTQDPCVSDSHAFALGRNNGGENVLMKAMAVRRLTPVECERLQGFPDHYTDIKPKGKPTPDGPRYKALGNSWAVPVARWIGERIMAVEAIK